MLIKKNEEPFFHRFLTIVKEIIKKNGEYLSVLYGDDEKLYFVCDNYAAIYDHQSNLIANELFEFGKVPYELSELPNGDLMLTRADNFNCQESYLLTVKKFFETVGYMSTKITSVEKGDPYRIAKLTETTGCWLSDEDNKILDKFKSADLYFCDRDRIEEFSSKANGWNPYYLSVHDYVELSGGQTTIAMTIYFNIKVDPKRGIYDQQSLDLHEYENVSQEDEEIENVEEVIEEPEETYQEEQELDSLMNETIIEETRGAEDEFDPMRA